MTLSEILEIIDFSYEVDVDKNGNRCYYVLDNFGYSFCDDEDEAACYNAKDVMQQVSGQLESSILAWLSDEYGCPYYETYDKYKEWVIKNRGLIHWETSLPYKKLLQLIDCMINPDLVELDKKL